MNKAYNIAQVSTAAMVLWPITTPPAHLSLSTLPAAIMTVCTLSVISPYHRTTMPGSTSTP